MPDATSTIWRRRVVGLVLVVSAGSTLVGCSALSGILGGDAIPEGETDVFTLKVGDCLNDSGESEVTSVAVVDCTQPHDYEAYLSAKMDDGAFPGDDAVATFGDEACGAAFEAFIGAPEAETSLSWTYYSPLAGSWAGGDRETLCLATDLNGKVSETLQGAGPRYPFE